MGIGRVRVPRLPPSSDRVLARVVADYGQQINALYDEVTSDYEANPDLAARWEDLRAPATVVKFGGGGTDPTFNTTDCTLDFAASDIVYINLQLPHSWTPGLLYPHVHWKQEENHAVYWTIDYKIVTNGHTVPAAFTTLAMYELVYTYTSGDLAQISIPAGDMYIDASAYPPSSVLQVKLSRAVGDSYTVDAQMYEFDLHYQVGDLGSVNRSSF